MLERLVNGFCHHVKTVLGSFHVDHVGLALVFSGLVLKILSRLSPCIGVHLYLHAHQVKEVIDLLEHLAASLLQRNTDGALAVVNALNGPNDTGVVKLALQSLDVV